MQVLVRMWNPVGMRVRMAMRARRSAKARLDPAKLPEGDRRGPSEQEERDDEVTQYTKIKFGDEVIGAAVQVEHPD